MANETMMNLLTHEIELLKKTAALTGGIAAGKSTVAGIFRELGASIVDTDAIAREIVHPGGPVLASIINAFGKDYLKTDGTLNREMMRSAIVRSGEKRLLLNSLIHPAIMNETLRQIGVCLAQGSNPVIADIPLLFETGWDNFFSVIILVYVPGELQAERLMKRDSLDRAAALETISAQMDIETKKGRAKIVIDNSGTIEDTRRAAEGVYKILTSC